jgi:hypothetical protein
MNNSNKIAHGHVAGHPVAVSRSPLPPSEPPLHSSWVFVTPSLAAEWLRHNRNRSLNRARVEQCKRDLVVGEFFATHQGVAFRQDGSLGDGQHRLTAIVETGIGLWLLVTWGLSDGAVLVVDSGAVRTVAHGLQLSTGDSSYSHRLVAAIIATFYGPAMKPSVKLTRPEIKALLDRHGGALRFAFSALGSGTRRVCSAGSYAAVARASYHAPHQDLANFCKLVINDPDVDSSLLAEARARTAFSLRRSLESMSLQGGDYQRVGTYCRFQRALRGWLDGECLLKLYATNDDLFPLPDGLS